MMDSELIIRCTREEGDDASFHVEAKWVDTKSMVILEVDCDASRLKVVELFELVEIARLNGEAVMRHICLEEFDNYFNDSDTDS